MNFKPGEIRIESIDRTPKGGQHCGVLPNEVKVTHIPTGLTASCGFCRSQSKNREIAAAMLERGVSELANQNMNTLCIYCPEIAGERDEAQKHFDARGIPVEFVRGIHAMSAGLLCHKPHGLNGTTDLINSYKHVGLCLSHYMCWQIFQLRGNDSGLILEADAKFPIDWKDRFGKLWRTCPNDWDIILLGNSHTQDKERKHIAGDLWEVKYPFCCHAYMVRQKALPILLDTCRHVNMNVDIMLIKHAYPSLRVYTVLPRLVEQRFTELPV